MTLQYLLTATFAENQALTPLFSNAMTWVGHSPKIHDFSHKIPNSTLLQSPPLLSSPPTLILAAPHAYPATSSNHLRPPAPRPSALPIPHHISTSLNPTSVSYPYHLLSSTIHPLLSLIIPHLQKIYIFQASKQPGNNDTRQNL